jgi:hypothetical protein
MKQAPHDAQPSEPTQVRSQLPGLFLGLLPLLIWVGACVWMLLEGRCQPHPQSSLLALLALLLWGAEGVGGLLGLLAKRIRALAQALLLTLMISLPFGSLMGYLTLVSLFCLHITF